MFNKLSFLPTESLYPVCLSLDDFEDDEQVEHIQSALTDHPDYTHKYIRYMEILSKRVCEGTLSAKEEKELINSGKILLSHEGILHKNALDKLIARFVRNIKGAKNQAGLKSIKLRVVSEDNMINPFNKADFSMEYYGYYDSYNSEIVLCPERISKAPAKLKKHHCYITSRELYVVVLVHALAHVLIDPTKSEEKSYAYQPIITTQNGFSEREVLMEESLANMITLQVFAKLGKPEVVRYGEVREFIGIQPLPYRYGLDQFDILKPDWRLWREAKKTTKFIKDK
jgi:hypothetical protein